MERIYFIALLLCSAVLLMDGQVRAIAANLSYYKGADSQLSKHLRAVNQSKIDHLFQRLKRARTEAEGRMIEFELWQYWTKSGHADIESLMRRAHFLAQRGYLKLAARLLDRVVAERPDFVDGWNRRANVFYLMRRYNEALQSIARVLALEPRHFGALTGKAFIKINAGRWQEALECLRRAVEIHPFLHERYLLRILEKKLQWRRL
ncbi:MAG: tetratricopeptide repeat protein [Hyphomicrobiaceae bacterium]|nr:tetratricopeptide repeat protein [Hyphomicrobiaceae bacterium]